MMSGMTHDEDDLAAAGHVFVILRWDNNLERVGSDPTECVAGTKAYKDEEAAEAECARLNALNEAKGSRYFVVMARLQS